MHPSSVSRALDTQAHNSGKRYDRPHAATHFYHLYLHFKTVLCYYNRFLAAAAGASCGELVNSCFTKQNVIAIDHFGHLSSFQNCAFLLQSVSGCCRRGLLRRAGELVFYKAKRHRDRSFWALRPASACSRRACPLTRSRAPPRSPSPTDRETGSAYGPGRTLRRAGPRSSAMTMSRRTSRDCPAPRSR